MSPLPTPGLPRHRGIPLTALSPGTVGPAQILPQACSRAPAVVHQAVNLNPTHSKPLVSHQPLQALIRKASLFKMLHNVPKPTRLVQQSSSWHYGAVRTA